MIFLLGCAAGDADQARTAWIREQLANDNAVWLSRDPDLLAMKYARMAADRFDFLRGTAGLFLADVARPDPSRTPTTFLTEPDASVVLLAGDPHPENVGTMGDAESLTLEATDLDGAAFGPYLVDVRRAALGVAVLADDAGCACAEAAVEALAMAYQDGLDGGPLACDDVGAVFAERCSDAADDAAAGEPLVDLVADGRFVTDETVDEEGKGMLELTPEEDAQVDRLLAAWSAPAGFRRLDAVRRYGVGVASLPAVRYAVLWDTGVDGTEDDALLNLREVVDPPLPPGRSSTIPLLYASNAARIEKAARRLWSRPDADPLLAGLADGDQTFKVTSWSAWFDGIDHEDLLGASEADVVGLASDLGRVLGATHARGLTSRGEQAGPVIVADIGGRTGTFAEELQADATADLQGLDRDHALFVRALALYGPLLGADTPVADVAP